MAKLHTLIDDFQDGSIDASKWTTIGTVTETGGRAVLTPTTSFSFLGTNARTYDLSLSHVIADIPAITSNGSTGTLQSGLVVDKDTNNLIGMRKVGDQLVCTKSVFGIETQLSFALYNSTNHRFWRIRADATNIYWETSATGTGYFIQNTASIATLGFAITVVGCYFYTGYSGIELFPGTLQIEAINPGLSITARGESTSTGSLAISLSTPDEITASGLSTSTGSLALTLSTPSDLSISASASSTSTGSFNFYIPAPVVLPGGTWFFEPPIAYDNPPTLPRPIPKYINAHARWKGGQRRGRSVLKTGSTYTIIDTPSQDQMDAADITYLGGHIYEVTTQEAYELWLAGFNVYHGTDLLLAESGDFLTTESGDLIQVEYSFGPS